MRAVMIGGAGFVGLNIVEHLLARGDEVILVDRGPPPASALEAFAALPGRLAVERGDVIDPASIAAAIRPGTEAVVYGAAITADATRDATEPERILTVNLGGLVPVLRAAKAAGVGRVLNLSSGAAIGRAATEAPLLEEDVRPDPVSLYALTKFGSERLAARLGELWGLDVVNVRLSSVFGPWERATGVRDTLSPFLQMLGLARERRPALLERPGLRDWIYAPDVAEAVRVLLSAGRLPHRLYNITTGRSWTVLDWGEGLARLRPGFECRLAGPGETPTVDLHAAIDRAPLAHQRLERDHGWRARFGLEDAAAHLAAWDDRFGGR